MTTMPAPLRVIVGVASAFLLISMGGQAAAAPITVPLLWWAVRSTRSIAARLVFTLIASLTMAVLGWVVVYLIAGERRPDIYLSPSIAGIATLVGFLRTTRPA